MPRTSSWYHFFTKVNTFATSSNTFSHHLMSLSVERKVKLKLNYLPFSICHKGKSCQILLFPSPLYLDLDTHLEDNIKVKVPKYHFLKKTVFVLS